MPRPLSPAIRTHRILPSGYGPAVAVLLMTCALVGCAEMPDLAQTLGGEPVGEIQATRTVGQSFVAVHDGLSRIDVQLATYARRNTHPVVFHLRSDPYASTDIATTVFQADEVVDNAYRAFHFPAIADSGGRTLYFFFESPDSEPGDALTLWYSPGDVYADGQMYIEGSPQDGDLVFKTFYAYGLVAILRDLSSGARTHTLSILLVMLLYLLPGAALLRLVNPHLNLSLSQRLILSAGLTAALVPILFLIAHWLGLRLGRLPVALLLIGSGLVVLWRADLGDWLAAMQRLDGVDMILGAIFVLTLAARLLVVRDLSTPMWVDSYHHTMIAQLMVDNDGLFHSWDPYAPLQSFTYHYGFHAQAAVLHWLSGLSVVQSVILTGQLLNALMTLAVSFFAVRLTGSRWAGLFAALLTGAVSSLPMGYVNWGRYTQLAGQFILPFAIILTHETLKAEATDWRLLALTAVTAAGLALTHYGGFLFYICFLPAVIVLELYHHWRERNSVRALLSRLAVMSVGTLLITAPWLWNILRGLLPRMVAGLITIGPQSAFVRAHNALGNPLGYVDAPLQWLSILGGVLGVILKNRGAILILLWVPALFLLSNPHVVHLPGTGVVNNFAVMISLYIPAAALSGWFVGRVVEAIEGRWPSVRPAFLISALALAGIGISSQFPVLDMERALVTAADEAAMVWIQDNTPLGAKFLVSADFPSYYNGKVVMGEDAGLWIPLLAHRETTLPPLVHGMEAPEEPDQVTRGNDFNRVIQSIPPDSPEAVRLLKEHGVTHVYVGRNARHMDPLGMSESSYYRPIYQKNGVWIFEVEADAA